MAGMKYKDIAAKYNVSIDTVKSWKKRHKWERKKGAHKIEKGCTQKIEHNASKKEPIVDEVKDVLENTGLTEKQRLFCIYFARYFNATKAYQKAYDCKYETAAINGSRMLRNAKVKKQIDELKQEKLNQSYLTDADIFQKYMDIAFADIGDYLQFGPKGVILNNSSDVDTSIIAEVAEGKNGIKLKLADRMRALDWLSEHMDMASAGQKEEYADKQSKVAAILKQLKNVEDKDIYE